MGVRGGATALTPVNPATTGGSPLGVAAAGAPGAMPELPPPGWYEDPQGKGWRWWDGSHWTEPPPPGWYQDPEGKGWRWWGGSRWTEHWEGQARATKTPPSQAAASRDRLGLALVGMLALIGVSLIVIATLKFI